MSDESNYFEQPNQEYMESLDFIENDSMEDVSMENDSTEDVSLGNGSIENDSIVNDSIVNDSIENDTNQSMDFDLDESNEQMDVNSNVKKAENPVLNSGDAPPKVERTTNWEFYESVRKYTKTNKVKFQISKKLTSAVKECLKLWFRTETLTKKQHLFSETFAKQVPAWYNKAKNEARLYAGHSCKYLSI